MVVKTLITDGFDEGGEWLDADDMALLKHTFMGIVEKAVMKREEASRAWTEEPADMTVLFLADGPPDFPRIWIRNDRKRIMLGHDGLDPNQRWQREGSEGWYTWGYVLKVTRQGRIIPIYVGSQS